MRRRWLINGVRHPHGRVSSLNRIWDWGSWSNWTWRWCTSNRWSIIDWRLSHLILLLHSLLLMDRRRRRGRHHILNIMIHPLLLLNIRERWGPDYRRGSSYLRWASVDRGWMVLFGHPLLLFFLLRSISWVENSWLDLHVVWVV